MDEGTGGQRDCGTEGRRDRGTEGWSKGETYGRRKRATVEQRDRGTTKRDRRQRVERQRGKDRITHGRREVRGNREAEEQRTEKRRDKGTKGQRERHKMAEETEARWNIGGMNGETGIRQGVSMHIVLLGPCSRPSCVFCVAAPYQADCQLERSPQPSTAVTVYFNRRSICN